jgi:hypothetical protein
VKLTAIERAFAEHAFMMLKSEQKFINKILASCCYDWNENDIHVSLLGGVRGAFQVTNRHV